MSSLTTSISPGSWILVTGASGFLASHVCLQFLERGFKVRGSVRDPTQSSWLLEGPFKSYAAIGAIELASVPHLGADGAYYEAIKGVAAIIHIAYVTNIVPDPSDVITPMVAGVRSIMNAAIREPSVKEVVFTSSALAASSLLRGIDNGTIGRDSWNDAVLEAAWAPPPYGVSHAMANYPASKVAAEKEVWKFVDGVNLHFNVNVVSPAGITGEPLNKKHIEGQANWVVHAYRGNKAAMDPLQASFYVDVKDVALIHVAAVLDPEVKSARLQCWGHSAHWNEVLSIMRRLRPQKKFVDGYPDLYHLEVSLDQTESLTLLKKWSDKPDRNGWTSLEDSIFENITNPYLEG
ncbi:related to NADPH-dependent aldehyde reductase [Cephalotrichum gorgonifer]|uniref:Related to NADPH-dependent aldehyde reductase n=1 Tax=Cephalotrichum gorgonifer TaxID=2041049 RepID=A0AAE8MVY8_9PEZI|nr:related to NADPH-dependent aldehyde reductase [Cephalotrichum gorgonifer]